MPTAEVILTEDVPNEGVVLFKVTDLRHGDIEEGEHSLTVGGFAQTEVTYSADYERETIYAVNRGVNPWSTGAKCVLTWSGYMIQPAVTDHETRITALEAGGGSGTGGEFLPLTGGTVTGELTLAGADPSHYALIIDTADLTNAAGILSFTGGIRRWELELGDSTDGVLGTNEAANFAISRYDDLNGSVIDTPLTISRKTGVVDFIETPTVAGVPISGGGAIPVQFVFHFVGQPETSAIYTVPTAIAVTIPAGLVGSVVYDRTQCTANAAFILSKIAKDTSAITQLGSITVTRTSHMSCNLAGAGGSLMAGDVLQITAPVQDATLADVSFTIMATQS